jgi:hypothetical protein
MMMQLVIEALKKQLPPLYATEKDEDPMVWCKFFYPFFAWTWYAIEFDGDDLFFGFVDGDYPELGYFSLSELTKTPDKMGRPIERAMDFQPCRLSALRRQLGR